MMTRLCAAALAVVLCLPSIASSDDKTSVTIAAHWEVASYDPDVAGFAIQKLQIMENLVDADETGTLRPGLATSWEASDDGLTWTFVLRQTGTRLVRHARYAIFQFAEAALPRSVFAGVLGLINGLRGPPAKDAFA